MLPLAFNENWILPCGISIMGLNYLSEIKSDRGTWKVKVKVIYIWEYKNSWESNTQHMIMADKKVHLIYNAKYDIKWI